MTAIPENLAGKRVLVTGGSRGLGEAIVRRLATAGATVVATARSAPADPDFPAEFVAADLATADGARRLAGHLMDTLGGVDVLVDNAGGGSAPGPTLQRSDDDWHADVEQNLMSAVRLDRLLVPGMVERGHGVVVHVSSIASKLGPTQQASYAAVKAAMNSYSRSLAAEVGQAGVRVVCVLPGFIATPGAVAQHQRMADEHGIGLSEMQQRLASELDVPLDRPGHPTDAAELVAFLVSDRARWLTGAQFRVDGGILTGL